MAAPREARDASGDASGADRGGAVRFDPPRDWRVKYLQLTWNLTRLRRAHADARTAGSAALAPDASGATASGSNSFGATASGANAFGSAARVAFAACVDLADWLLADAPAGVAEDDVARLLAADPLRVAVALVRGVPSASAVLLPSGLGNAAHGWVEYRRDAVRSVRFDVLDLAERCVASWNSFLTVRDVALPTWAPTRRLATTS